MPINIKPKYDAAIECHPSGITLYFGRVPDFQVEADIYSMTKENPGLLIEEEDYCKPIQDLPAAKVFYSRFLQRGKQCQLT